MLFIVVIDLILGLVFLSSRVNFRRSDTYFHHGLVPNTRSVGQWFKEDTYPVYVNSLGMLDREVRDVPLDPGAKRRIVMLGDSFTEGMGFPFKKTFTGLLNDKVDSAKTEILNAGVSSYSPKLYYYKTKYLIEEVGLKFDELFVLIDISDVQDEVLYKTFTPRIASAIERLGETITRFLKRRSYIYASAEGLYNREKSAKKRKKYKKEYYPPWLDYFWMDNVNPMVYQVPNYAALRETWTEQENQDHFLVVMGLNLAGEHMAKLAELTKSRNIKLTIGVYPWPAQLFSKDIDSIQVRYWRDFASTYGLDFINLFDTFINNGLTPDQTYLMYHINGDVHWNEAGHKVVADTLFKWIKTK